VPIVDPSSSIAAETTVRRRPLKTLIIQSYRTRDVPSWIARCLSSVRAWAETRGYDHRLTDDSVFSLCGDEYLAQVGDNKRSITNLCRLELIKLALAEGYERAIWMDADILVFAPDRLDFAPTQRISFPRETWLAPSSGPRWTIRLTLNNCVVVCPRGDPDLDLIIQATRHRARHPVTDNLQVGVELVRGLHSFMMFPLLSNVGMFSNHTVMAIGEDREEAIHLQAIHHGTPVYAANLCASDHLSPVVPETVAHTAIDRLERTAGDVVNGHLSATGEPSRYPRARLILG
jgi:hypothetical protein